MKTTKRAYLCGVDWQHELGECDVKVYPKSDHPDLVGHVGCGVVEVDITLVRWVEEQDLEAMGEKTSLEADRELLRVSLEKRALLDAYIHRLRDSIDVAEGKPAWKSPQLKAEEAAEARKRFQEVNQELRAKGIAVGAFERAYEAVKKEPISTGTLKRTYRENPESLDPEDDETYYGKGDKD